MHNNPFHKFKIWYLLCKTWSLSQWRRNMYIKFRTDSAGTQNGDTYIWCLNIILLNLIRLHYFPTYRLSWNIYSLKMYSMISSLNSFTTCKWCTKLITLWHRSPLMELHTSMIIFLQSVTCLIGQLVKISFFRFPRENNYSSLN
jgi:hypothetical protein